MDGKRTLVGLAHYPGWSVTDTEIQDLAGLDELVQGLHDLLDGGAKVPPVDVELSHSKSC